MQTETPLWRAEVRVKGALGLFKLIERRAEDWDALWRILDREGYEMRAARRVPL